MAGMCTPRPGETPGNVSPEGFQHGVNFRRGDVFASETGMTAGFTAAAEGETILTVIIYLL